MANTTALLVAATALGMLGCSAQTSGYPSSEGKPTPYVMKQDCTFSIVEQLSRASVTSPTVTGMPGATASMSISLGDKSITVSDCMVIANSHSLPIYED